MPRPFTILLTLTFTCLLLVEPAIGQSNAALQLGTPIERSLALGQSHSFTINLEPDQFLQFVVEQHGIDVIVRVFSPAGKSMGEFDSPNGKDGPENVSVVADAAGSYRIEVALLGQELEPAPGRYEIKVVELRAATEQEIQTFKNQEALKVHGLALLSVVADSLTQLRVLQTRVKAQMQTAELLWPTNEKLATKLAAEAIEDVTQFLNTAYTSEVGGPDYYQGYRAAMELRQEVIQVLGPHDPEMALGFLHATRRPAIPELQGSSEYEERALELTLANQVIAKDPKVAVRIAQDSLKKGYSQTVLEVIFRLRGSAPEPAAQLARDLASKLMSEKLLETPEAASLALNLLRTAHAPVVRFPPYTNPPPKMIPLLSEQEYKDLFEKTLGEALSYKAPSTTEEYSPAQNTAQEILTTLSSSMSSEMSKYAPASVAALQKKITEMTEPGDDPDSKNWQKYQETISEAPLEAAVAEIEHAPKEMKEGLSQMVLQRAMTAGDLASAKQIAKNLPNPMQRRQFLAQLEIQEILQNAQKGKIEEALRGVENLKTSRERGAILSQFVKLIGPGRNRAQALELLEQARRLVSGAVRVESPEQMNALLEIARAFSIYDSKRAFEIVEPLLDQFNEMSAAALVLDGFGQQYYQDGELQLHDSGGLGAVGNQLIDVLGSLARANFDRAKAGADRIERQEVRIVAYLSIAQEVLAPGQRRGVVTDVRRPPMMID